MLESKNARVPPGIDLSGQWTLRGDDDARRRTPPQSMPFYERRSTSRNGRQAKPGRSVEIFLEYGRSLKVSQTPYSLFISYDRAVVEEYTFGENRLINVGPIEAKRVSGWDGESFVVETLDEEGATLFETWTLRSSDVLQREVRVEQNDQNVFSLQQVFDRS